MATFLLYNDVKTMHERNEDFAIDALKDIRGNVKEKCSAFIQCKIQQPIMSINKVISHMTELSDHPRNKDPGSSELHQ